MSNIQEEGLAQAEERLERAESTPVAEPSIEIKAEEEALSFGEVREKESIWQFKVLFNFSIFISLQLYLIFFYWATHEEFSKNWHTGLMLIIPATTVLLALILSLRHNKSKRDETDTFIPQLKQTIEIIKEAKELIS